MASLAPKTGGGFADRIAAAQRDLDESILRAGLQRDPYRHVHEALGAALGTFPELIEHLEATRRPVRDEDLRRAVVQGVSLHTSFLVRTMGWRNVLIGSGLLVAALLIGAGGGYWFRGETPALAGVRAGADHCDDRPDGSRLCWIPVFARMATQSPTK